MAEKRNALKVLDGKHEEPPALHVSWIQVQLQHSVSIILSLCSPLWATEEVSQP
jgi:hypothetical protein